jgi:hypothetical protein
MYCNYVRHQPALKRGQSASNRPNHHPMPIRSDSSNSLVTSRDPPHRHPQNNTLRETNPHLQVTCRQLEPSSRPAAGIFQTLLCPVEGRKAAACCKYADVHTYTYMIYCRPLFRAFRSTAAIAVCGRENGPAPGPSSRCFMCRGHRAPRLRRYSCPPPPSSVHTYNPPRWIMTELVGEMKPTLAYFLTYLFIRFPLMANQPGLILIQGQ